MNLQRFGSVAILSGGQSKRMGFDKSFITFNGKKLADIMIDRLSSEFSEFIISSNLGMAYLEHDVKYVRDIYPGMGPLSGIHAALKAASSKYVYFIACDMPEVNIDYIKYMKQRIGDNDYDICCTASSGDRIETFNAFYSTSILPDLDEYLKSGKTSLRDFIFSKKYLLIEEKIALTFSPDWGMFRNLNTPTELNEYKSARF